MDMKIEIKEEPVSLETPSTEVNHSSDIHIKNESAILSSDEFQSEGEIQRQASEMDMKIEIKEEPISLETPSTEVNHSSDIHIKNESAILSSDEFQSEGEMPRQASEMDMKIEIKEEPISLETPSTEVNHSSDIHIKNEPAVLSSDDDFQSEGEIQRQASEMDMKIEIKEEPISLETPSTEVNHSSDIHIKNEPAVLSSDDDFQSEGEIQRQASEMDMKIEFKEEPISLERTSTEEKFESEVTHGSDIHIKNEPAVLSSDDEFQSNYEIYEDGNEIEIKEERLYLKEEDKVSEQHQELTESSRLDTEAVRNCEPSNICAGLDKDWLKLRERSSSHEKCNTIKAPVVNVTGRFNEDEKMSNKCRFCGKCFKLASRLQTHIVTHLSESKLKSNVRGNKITKPSQLGKHNLILKSKRLFKCDKCDKSYLTLLLLRAHSLFHEVNNKCDQYEQNFTSSSALKTHTLVHKVQNSYKCDQCEQSFTNSLDLETHNLVHKVQNSYKCDQCEQSFTTSSDLETHNLVHKVQNSYKCDQCEQSFTTSSDLETHNLVHKVQKSHKCNQCEHSFASSSDLKAHNVIHEVKKSYKCDQCEQSFKSSSDLKTHNAVHEVKHAYKCFRCGESFTTALNLKIHKLVHKGQGPLKCDQCRKRFNKLAALRHHKLVHEGRSPHKCKHCQKYFSKASYLNKHMLIHSKDKKYKCDICQKSYSRAPSLRAHILSHEGKRHKCDICEKTFTAASYLKDHILIHEGKSPYTCNICDRTCTSASNLKSHILYHIGKRLTITEKASS